MPLISAFMKWSRCITVHLRPRQLKPSAIQNHEIHFLCPMWVSLMSIHTDSYKYLPNVHWYLSIFKNKAFIKHFVPSCFMFPVSSMPVPLYLHSVHAPKNQRWTALSKKVAKGSSYLCEIYSHEFLKIFQASRNFCHPNIPTQDVCFNY